MYFDDLIAVNFSFLFFIAVLLVHWFRKCDSIVERAEEMRFKTGYWGVYPVEDKREKDNESVA